MYYIKFSVVIYIYVSQNINRNIFLGMTQRHFLKDKIGFLITIWLYIDIFNIMCKESIFLYLNW